jgi:hypothetical protein
MLFTLCGGGMYNADNGGLYSLDAYDPYSGVPFNAWLNEKVIPSSSNRFQARYNRSVAKDYMGQQDNIVISTDATRSVGEGDDKDMTELDFIPDTSSSDIVDVMDDNEQMQLIKAVLDDQVPERFRLKDKEKEILKNYYFKGMSKVDSIMAVGYSRLSARQLGKNYLGTEKGEGKDGSIIKKLTRAINYLQKKKIAETTSYEEVKEPEF